MPILLAAAEDNDGKTGCGGIAGSCCGGEADCCPCPWPWPCPCARIAIPLSLSRALAGPLALASSENADDAVPPRASGMPVPVPVECLGGESGSAIPLPRDTLRALRLLRLTEPAPALATLDAVDSTDARLDELPRRSLSVPVPVAVPAGGGCGSDSACAPASASDGRYPLAPTPLCRGGWPAALAATPADAEETDGPPADASGVRTPCPCPWPSSMADGYGRCVERDDG